MRLAFIFTDMAPRMQIVREFSFDAAHFLTKYHGKCEHLHGHTYFLWVTIEGEIQENGMVLDFGFIKTIVKERVLDKYDHRCLNDFFENPTAELVAKAIWDDLVDLPELLKKELEDPNMPEEIRHWIKGQATEKQVNPLVKLVEIKLAETPTSSVVYRGEMCELPKKDVTQKMLTNAKEAKLIPKEELLDI